MTWENSGTDFLDALSLQMVCVVDSINSSLESIGAALDQPAPDAAAFARQPHTRSQSGKQLAEVIVKAKRAEAWLASIERAVREREERLQRTERLCREAASKVRELGEQVKEEKHKRHRAERLSREADGASSSSARSTPPPDDSVAEARSRKEQQRLELLKALAGEDSRSAGPDVQMQVADLDVQVLGDSLSRERSQRVIEEAECLLDAIVADRSGAQASSVDVAAALEQAFPQSATPRLAKCQAGLPSPTPEDRARHPEVCPAAKPRTRF
eukprot:m51a1_g4860 hypothetical protein (271) ;mRNA; f:316002-317305